MPQLGRIKRSDLQELRSLVAHELGRKRRAQEQPAPANALSEARATGLTGEDEGGEGTGYASDPGSCGSPVLRRSENQSISILMERIDSLEERVKKVDELESRCLSLEQRVDHLETENSALKRKLREHTHDIEANEEYIRNLESDLSDTQTKLDDKLKEVENTLQTRLPAAAAPQTGSQASVNNNDLSDKVKELEDTLKQLESKVNSFGAGSSSGGCTPWQQWKKKACDIVGAANPNQKSRHVYNCYDSNCKWKNKKVTLNAYIHHLKRNPHLIAINNNPDDMYLPRV